ncbi:MAG: hypothetical protein WCT11_01030 [Candidatus Magasanikbacteria bacterium]|jgi:hypothetical protein
MVTFGEVIKYKELEYVYLAATEEIIYLAKILNRADGEAINRLYLKRQNQGALSNVKIADSPLYCFVQLTTNEYRDRLAHFHQPGQDFGRDYIMDSIGRLNDADLKEIKETITTGPVPIELKELVKNIEL